MKNQTINPTKSPEESRKELHDRFDQLVDDYMNLEIGSKEFDKGVHEAVLSYGKAYDAYWIEREGE